MHRGDELRAFVRERRAAKQDVRGVFDFRERAASAVTQCVRHLRAGVATPHHLCGNLVAAPAEHDAPTFCVTLTPMFTVTRLDHSGSTSSTTID